MPLLFLALLPALLLIAVALIPLSLFLRYRTGTARRPARAWLAAINAAGFALSCAAVVVTAAIADRWVAGSLRQTLVGLAVGAALGFAGLAATRWDVTPRGLYFMPNRWLVLLISLTVTARVLFGFYRAYDAWAAGGGQAWVVTSGAAASASAGAVVLAYYLVYWGGVRRRLARYRAEGR